MGNNLDCSACTNCKNTELKGDLQDEDYTQH